MRFTQLSTNDYQLRGIANAPPSRARVECVLASGLLPETEDVAEKDDEGFDL
jgi:hypothetical protein